MSSKPWFSFLRSTFWFLKSGTTAPVLRLSTVPIALFSPACVHTWCGEGTPVHSHNHNLGVISSKDEQIKAALPARGHFIKPHYPAIWPQTNREPTPLQIHLLKHFTCGKQCCKVQIRLKTPKIKMKKKNKWVGFL